MKQKLFRDPNYAKLLKLMTIKNLASRKKEFLQIKYSDPGKLLQLMRNLYESDTTKVQVKVNSYLQEVTGAYLSFLIEECSKTPEAVVRVIGTRVLSSRILFQVDNDFITRLRKNDCPIAIPKCFIDSRLLETMKEILALSLATTYKNCIIFPIFHPYKKKVVFYSVLVNYDATLNVQQYYHGLVGECFRYCQEIVLNAMRYNEEKYFHRKYKEILSSSLNNIKHIENLPALITSIRSALLSIFDAERLYIFIVEGKQICTRISEYGQAFDTSDEIVNDIKIPFGLGLSGTAAETGRIINTPDPESDPLYRRDLEIATRKKSRNILTFPILLYTGVYGVIQVHDKIEACHFDSADVQFARYLGPAIGIQLHMCLAKKKLWDAINRRSMTEELFLTDSKVIDSEEINSVVACSRKHEYVDFLSYKFLPAGVDSKDVLCLSYKIFDEFGLLSLYTIERRIFIKFLVSIRNRHRNYPLHNWQHSFCAFHFLHTVVKNENLLDTNKFRPIELFAMLLASLCHNMEFRGPVSPYQPTTGTVLASLYSSQGSLLQYYSTAQLVRIANSKECCITQAMEAAEYREFIKQIDQIFLYMDLAYFVSNKTRFSEIGHSYDSSTPEHKAAMMPVLLTCSEISDYCKPFEYCNPFSDATSEEFYSTDMMDCSGVIDISGFTDNIQLKKVELQIHFVQNVCLDAFMVLAKFLPGTSSCYSQVEENCRKFKIKKDDVIQQQMEQV